jgi:hypothetical protein
MPVRWVGLVSDPHDPAKTVQTERYERFQDRSGNGAFPPVIPVVLASLATAVALARKGLVLLVLALMMLAYGVITGFSIGAAYLPAGAVLVVAAGIALALRPNRSSGVVADK